MHKKAYQHIWLPFLQFSTVFNETLSKGLFFQGRLNETFKSELTLLFFHSFQGGTKGKKLKNQNKQKKCSQMCSQAFLCISPFKLKVLKYSRNYSLHNILMSKKNPESPNVHKLYNLSLLENKSEIYKYLPRNSSRQLCEIAGSISVGARKSVCWILGILSRNRRIHLSPVERPPFSTH